MSQVNKNITTDQNYILNEDKKYCDKMAPFPSCIYKYINTYTHVHTQTHTTLVYNTIYVYIIIYKLYLYTYNFSYST